MEGKERDGEMIINKICRKLKRTCLKLFSSKKEKKEKRNLLRLQTDLMVHSSQNSVSSFFSQSKLISCLVSLCHDPLSLSRLLFFSSQFSGNHASKDPPKSQTLKPSNSPKAMVLKESSSPTFNVLSPNLILW